MRFETPAGRRRRLAFDAGFLPQWRPWLEQRIPHWAHMAEDQRNLLEEITLELMIEKSWEPAFGFAITDEVKVTIAGQAALLVLGLPEDSYRDVGSIIVRQSTWVKTGEQYVGEGLRSRDPSLIIGETSYNGPVLIVWDSVLEELDDPRSGGAVVFHEFAHKLDVLDGTVDGMPPLTDRAQFDHWISVCTKIYDAIRRGEGPPSLIAYAGKTPGEFFAVATEAFFARPVALHDEVPDLYKVLKDFYRQDPRLSAR